MNRKIQGKKNLKCLSLNDIYINPIPDTFDLSNLTGLRLAVVDSRTILILGSYCKRIVKLEVY